MSGKATVPYKVNKSQMTLPFANDRLKWWTSFLPRRTVSLQQLCKLASDLFIHILSASDDPAADTEPALVLECVEKNRRYYIILYIIQLHVARPLHITHEVATFIYINLSDCLI